MKLSEINREKIKTKTVKSTDETFQRLKIVAAHTQRTQNEVLSELLAEELKRLNVPSEL